MKLVIAEKPSVAQSIAKVLGAVTRKNGYLEGNDFIVSWCVGHLVSLAPPDVYDEKYKKFSNYPIFPDEWRYYIKSTTKEQFNVLKSLIADSRVTSLVCATDAGREGELIFRHIYTILKCKKPFERLWISSLEDTAIKQGFMNLKDGHNYDNLYQAALCRERADWLVGINATRFFTCLYNADTVLNIGRVQTPTLAMIVNRDNEIANFVKQKYYTVELHCGEFKAVSDKITDLTIAENTKNNCNGEKKAVVVSVSKEEKKNAPPKLYDLTTLQRDANRIFGFTAQQTLESVQRLYDSKLATYPRTDSQYLTEDMEETANNIIDIIKQKFDFAQDSEYSPNIKVVMNNKKVSDHHAIIPTSNIATSDLSALTDSDISILKLIAHRLITATSAAYTYEVTKATLNCSGNMFYANGKVVIDKGYKLIEEQFKTSIGRTETNEQDNVLPNIYTNQILNTAADISEHYTTPPKPYTEDTLLSAMERAGNGDYDTDDVERKGLGTPATRAAIIEKIIAVGYVERSKKQLTATEKGKQLISVVSEDIKSAKMTADWENRLTLVAKGQADAKLFMSDIELFIKKIIATTNKANINFSTGDAVGKCPRCGNDVCETKYGFKCMNNSCGFNLSKNEKFFTWKKKKLNKDVAEKLLKNGRVHFKDLWSEEKKKTYEADIVMNDTGEKYIKFKIEF